MTNRLKLFFALCVLLVTSLIFSLALASRDTAHTQNGSESVNLPIPDNSPKLAPQNAAPLEKTPQNYHSDRKWTSGGCSDEDGSTC